MYLILMYSILINRHAPYKKEFPRVPKNTELVFPSFSCSSFWSSCWFFFVLEIGSLLLGKNGKHFYKSTFILYFVQFYKVDGWNLFHCMCGHPHIVRRTMTLQKPSPYGTTPSHKVEIKPQSVPVDPNSYRVVQIRVHQVDRHWKICLLP